MHETETRCAAHLAAALSIDVAELLEADEVLPHDGEARWMDGDARAQICVSASGRIEVTFDGWVGRFALDRADRIHYWLLTAAMAAIEEARSVSKEVPRETT
jgi:hypothetical protein